uniref:Uncharacterized protein n=1 Tax=Grammatophora oceanica TaxID=210454 RepID=A0A7S1UY09_9STRA
MFQAFKWTGSRWTNYGIKIYGASSGDRFGTSIGMNHLGDSIMVGIPNYDLPSMENVGMVQIYRYGTSSPYDVDSDGCTYQCWRPRGTIMGTIRPDSRFGQKVSKFDRSIDGCYFQAMASSHNFNEKSPGIEGGHEDLETLRFYGDSNCVVPRITASTSSSCTTQHFSGGLGYDFDLDGVHPFFCATTPNGANQTGTTSCFSQGVASAHSSYSGNQFQKVFEDMIDPPLLGDSPWLGIGPNVVGPSVAASAIVYDGGYSGLVRIATGYQSVILRDGEHVPGIVRVYQGIVEDASILT